MVKEAESKLLSLVERALFYKKGKCLTLTALCNLTRVDEDQKPLIKSIRILQKSLKVNGPKPTGENDLHLFKIDTSNPNGLIALHYEKRK